MKNNHITSWAIVAAFSFIFSMEAHLHHFNMRRYEGYDQAVEDEDNGTISIAVLFTVN